MEHKAVKKMEVDLYVLIRNAYSSNIILMS